MRLLTALLLETQPVGFLYHLTPVKNWKIIQKQGLVPQRGTLSRIAGEPRNLIYLFPDLESAHDAIVGWYGEHVDGDLAILEITPPPGVKFKSANTEGGWEITTTQPIPPEFIRLVKIDRDELNEARQSKSVSRANLLKAVQIALRQQGDEVRLRVIRELLRELRVNWKFPLTVYRGNRYGLET